MMTRNRKLDSMLQLTRLCLLVFNRSLTRVCLLGFYLHGTRIISLVLNLSVTRIITVVFKVPSSSHLFFDFYDHDNSNLLSGFAYSRSLVTNPWASKVF